MVLRKRLREGSDEEVLAAHAMRWWKRVRCRIGDEDEDKIDDEYLYA